MSVADVSPGAHEAQGAQGAPGADLASSSRAEIEASLVLKWRRRGDVWEGLVCRETADGTLLVGWLPALVLPPPMDSVAG